MSVIPEWMAHAAVLIGATAAHHISSTPPRIAQVSSDHLLHAPEDRKNNREVASGQEALHGQRWFNRAGMIGVALSRYVVWPITLLEVLARLLSQFPSSSLSRAILPVILPGSAPEVAILTVSPPARPHNLLLETFSRTFIFAALSIFIGYSIRRKCFAVMGRHFSFTHTTLEGHQLVKSGPYSIVRHPSYTGEVLVRGGMAMLLLAPGGFVRACGALQHSAGFFHNLNLPQQILVASVRTGVAYHIAWITFGCTYLIWRAPLEDATLRATFGKQWDDYAKEVPYRFIPYVA